MANIRLLQLSKLQDEKDIPGLGETNGKYMAQACAICFNSNNHSKGVTINLKYKVNEITQDIPFVLEDWEAVSDNMRRQWGDPDVALEFAAYGLSILFVFELTEFTAIERARKGGGFDYWLGKKEYDEEDPFKREARLEVSGLFNAQPKDVNRRLKEKIKQTKVSDTMGLPAFIGVIEFGKPTAHMVMR